MYYHLLLYAHTCIHASHSFTSPPTTSYDFEALVQQPGHRLPQGHHVVKVFAERQVQPALHWEPAAVVQMAFPQALLTWF